MKIIRNNIIPFKGFSVINLFGVLFVRKDCVISQNIVNHEEIHTAQMRELLYIGFYIIYFFEWMWKCIKYRDTIEAYWNTSFEREAYNNEQTDGYVKTRKHYAQWR
jgi:hypothetical protein